MAENNLISIIKNDLSIVDIIQNYISLTKKGANWWGVCPFHNDTKPSLSVNENRKMFKCFTCNVGGDAISFVERYKNISYFDAALEIAKNFNLDTTTITKFNQQYQINKELYRQYELNKDYLELAKIFLYQKSNPEGLEYLHNRQLSNEIIDYFGIGYVPHKFNQMYKLLTNEDNSIINPDKDHIYTRQEMLDNGLISITSSGDILDFFNGRVIFSIKDKDGNILGFSGRSIDGSEPKYLNTGETKIFKKHNVLYNWNNVSKLDNEDIYLVEGFMDVIALHRADIPNAVATMGVNLDQNHIRLIKQKSNFKNLILAYDNDNAGHNAIVKTGLSVAKQFNTFVVKPYDSQYKDFDELINKTGKENVQQIANNTEHFSIFYLNELAQDYNFNNQSNKQSYLIKATQFLKEFGNRFYYSNYITIIHNFTQFDSQLIENELKFLLIDKPSYEQDIYYDEPFDIIEDESFIVANNKNNNWNKPNYKSNNRFEFQVYKPKKEYKSKPNKDQLKNSYIKAQMRLINALLANKKAINIIDKNFAGIKCNEFKWCFNVIIEFYESYPNINSINLSQLHNLYNYFEDNGYELMFFNILKEQIQHNEIFKYEFDEIDVKKQAINAEISWIKYQLDLIAKQLSNSKNYDIETINNQIELLKRLKKLTQEIKGIEIYK